MANTHYSIMALILIFHIFITMAIAGRDIPNANVNKHDNDIKKPDFLFHDRGYLIPGVGRGIKPKCKDKLHPYTFSPITGRHDGGIAGIIGNLPTYGRVGGGSNIPGGDDTFVPNPGFEVPNPAGSGGAAPGPVQA